MSPQHPKVWLALIVALYLLLAALYATQVPAWQAPDEPAHYNYIHELATTGQFPVLRMGDYDQQYLEQLKAARFAPELPIAGVRYEAHQPPLYYLLSVPVFHLTGGELTALRLFSAALGALLLVLVYAIAATIFPGRLHLALAAAAFVAFLPMHLAIAASVNNDTLAEILLAALLLLSIRYVKTVVVDARAPSGGSVVMIGLLLGLALITKVSAYVAVPVVFAALLIAWYESRRNPLPAPRLALHALLIAAPALLIALPWYARNATVYGHLDILARRWHDTVVVGQLRTAELLAQVGLGAVLERFIVWSHASFWGVFGWMGVWMDGRVYTLLLAFSLAVLTGCIALAARKVYQPRASKNSLSSPPSPQPPLAYPQNRRAFGPTPHAQRFRRWALGLLALSALLTAGIYVSYNLIFVQPQGRYLFPALPTIGLAVALGWQEALRPAAARWTGIALISSAALAGLIGWLRQGVNSWSVALLGGAGAAFLVWSLVALRLSPVWQRRVATAAFVLPFALLALLDVAALVRFILPQLT